MASEETNEHVSAANWHQMGFGLGALVSERRIEEVLALYQTLETEVDRINLIVRMSELIALCSETIRDLMHEDKEDKSTAQWMRERGEEMLERAHRGSEE